MRVLCYNLQAMIAACICTRIKIEATGDVSQFVFVLPSSRRVNKSKARPSFRSLKLYDYITSELLLLLLRLQRSSTRDDGDAGAFDDIDAGRFFRVVERGDEVLKPFQTFLEGTSARCGRIRDSQREFLFRQDADEIGSAALIPLGDGAEIGFLAVGSVDSDRFHPGMSIDFLARVGDLVAGALKRY